jgi:chromosome segregation ATPase
MVKKRLSDLLQEEAHKSSPSDSESAIEVTATPVSSTSEEETEKNVNLEIEEAGSKSVQEESMPDDESTSARRTYATKAELEVTVKELREALEQANQTEASLQQKIADLQSTLAEHTELIDRLKKELQEAKQAAVHLAEANAKLMEEHKTATPERSNPKPVVAKNPYLPAPNLPVRPSDEQIQTPNQMWLLD